MVQAHPRLIQRSAALAMIAHRAGGDHIGPDVFTTHMARDDMVNGKVLRGTSAILADKIIPPEYLFAR